MSGRCLDSSYSSKSNISCYARGAIGAREDSGEVVGTGAWFLRSLRYITFYYFRTIVMTSISKENRCIVQILTWLAIDRVAQRHGASRLCTLVSSVGDMANPSWHFLILTINDCVNDLFE